LHVSLNKKRILFLQSLSRRPDSKRGFRIATFGRLLKYKNVAIIQFRLAARDIRLPCRPESDRDFLRNNVYRDSVRI
jgi:hypothetical protein